MRTLLVPLAILLVTPPLAASVVVAAMFGVPDGPGSIYDRVPRLWGKALSWAGGVRLHVHGTQHLSGQPRVFAANHTSWFDVFVLGSILSYYKFIAKAELERIPLFGKGMRAAGFIFVDRNNRKAAFAGYEAAAKRIRDGASVVVFPEGTRADEYPLRPFKKGPFVLAIAAGVPVVPTLVYGTREIQKRGSIWVRGGDVHVHFLEPIPTAGMDYEARNRISDEAWARMAEVLESVYGIPSTPERTRANSPISALAG